MFTYFITKVPQISAINVAFARIVVVEACKIGMVALMGSIKFYRLAGW